MKPRVLMVLLLVAGGAIVNVAVAWGCAYGARFPEGTLGTTRARLPLVAYPEQVQSEVGERQTKWRIHRASFEMWIDAHGVPLASLSSRAFVSPTWTGDFGGLSVGPLIDAQREGIPLALSVWEEQVWGSRQLPLRPIWPGFAINTVFYAAILWLLFTAPFALRRRRRIKRGKCARCGYPWGTGAVCSECGSAIVGRTAAVHGAPPPATPGPPSDRKHNT